MNLEKTPPKTPVKRTYTKKCLQEPVSAPSIFPSQENNSQLLGQLLERVQSLEHALDILLEPHSEQEDISECTTEEEDLN